MKLQERIRDWSQPIYFLGQNPVTLTCAVITTSTALTTIAFWFYDVFLPGPPHPCIYWHPGLSNSSCNFCPRSSADSTWHLAQKAKPSTGRETTRGFPRHRPPICPSCAEP
jgi:hypothetical protein